MAMPHKSKSNSPLFLFLALFLFFSVSLAVSNSTQSSSAACKSTPYPKLCRTILSTIRSSPSDPYGYGKFSVKQCLKQARRLSKIIGKSLSRNSSKSSLTRLEVGALDDCLDLTDDNVDFLETISDELKRADFNSSNADLVERVRTLLSAVVTNQQTCHDGLQDAQSSLAAVLADPQGDVSKLYSVSLGLVSQAVNRNRKKSKSGKSGDDDAGGTKVRTPLEQVIKLLRERVHNATWTRSSGERILAQLGSSEGILINNTVIVNQDGTDNFTTIGEAIAIAPEKTMPKDGYFIIYVREGVYEEYVVVPKHKRNVMLLGDGINRTVITGSHSFVDGWSTFNSSTMAVAGERFVAIDMTFKNTAGPEKHQAVAVRNSADLSTFYRCSFEGYQDTLYVHRQRQFYRDCDIYGTVDFICGNAAAVFQNCNLYARKPMANQKNAFTAQSRTDPNQNTGISIQNCRILAAPDLATSSDSNSNYLGRPWKSYSRTVYMQSYIGPLIHPRGWLEWNNQTIGLDTLYYGEFENYGPGADVSGRVQWPGYNLLKTSDAWNFTVYNFTLGETWLPNTDIPFSRGLGNQGMDT